MTHDAPDEIVAMLMRAREGQDEPISTEAVTETAVGNSPASTVPTLDRPLTQAEQFSLAAELNFGDAIAGRAAHRVLAAYEDKIKSAEAKYAAEIATLKAENASLRKELTQRELGLTGEDAAVLKHIKDKLSRTPGNLLNDLPALGRELMVLLGIGGLVANDYKPNTSDKREIVAKTIDLFGRKGPMSFYGQAVTMKVSLAAIIVGAAIVIGGFVGAVCLSPPAGYASSSQAAADTNAKWAHWLWNKTPTGNKVVECYNMAASAGHPVPCALPTVTVDTKID